MTIGQSHKGVYLALLTLATATPSLAIIRPIIAPSACDGPVLCCGDVSFPSGLLGLPILNFPYAATDCTEVTDMTLAPLTWYASYSPAVWYRH